MCNGYAAHATQTRHNAKPQQAEHTPTPHAAAYPDAYATPNTIPAALPHVRPPRRGRG